MTLILMIFFQIVNCDWSFHDLIQFVLCVSNFENKIKTQIGRLNLDLRYVSKLKATKVAEILYNFLLVHVALFPLQISHSLILNTFLCSLSTLIGPSSQPMAKLLVRNLTTGKYAQQARRGDLRSNLCVVAVTSSFASSLEKQNGRNSANHRRFLHHTNCSNIPSKRFVFVDVNIDRDLSPFFTYRGEF